MEALGEISRLSALLRIDADADEIMNFARGAGA